MKNVRIKLASIYSKFHQTYSSSTFFSMFNPYTKIYFDINPFRILYLPFVITHTHIFFFFEFLHFKKYSSFVNSLVNMLYYNDVTKTNFYENTTLPKNEIPQKFDYYEYIRISKILKYLYNYSMRL